MDEVEQKELEDQQKNTVTKKQKGSKAKGKKMEIPSPHGIRVTPRISAELKKKASAAIAASKRDTPALISGDVIVVDLNLN